MVSAVYGASTALTEEETVAAAKVGTISKYKKLKNIEIQKIPKYRNNTKI